MPHPPYRPELTVDTANAKYPATALAGFLRAIIVCLAVVFSVVCLRYGTAYLTALHSEAVIQSWFDGETIPAVTDIDLLQKNLESVREILPYDAEVKLALARLYLMRGRAENSAVYYEAARTVLNDSRLLQPSHFQPLALLVLLDDVQHVPLADALPNIERAIAAGAFEKDTQLIVGPIVIKNWQQLTQDTKDLAGPFIKSALREEETKQRMFKAMREYALVAPFLSYSSNKKTSAQLREMAREITQDAQDVTNH